MKVIDLRVERDTHEVEKGMLAGAKMELYKNGRAIAVRYHSYLKLILFHLILNLFGNGSSCLIHTSCKLAFSISVNFTRWLHFELHFKT